MALRYKGSDNLDYLFIYFTLCIVLHYWFKHMSAKNNAIIDFIPWYFSQTSEFFWLAFYHKDYNVNGGVNVLSFLVLNSLCGQPSKDPRGLTRLVKSIYVSFQQLHRYLYKLRILWPTNLYKCNDGLTCDALMVQWIHAEKNPTFPE